MSAAGDEGIAARVGTGTTSALTAARITSPREASGPEPLLACRDLVVNLGEGARARRLVGPLSLRVHAGECVAIVGESGSGKSLSALGLLDLLPRGLRAAGVIRAGGATFAPGEPAHARLRGRVLGYVPQDALAALHPLRTIGAQLDEVLRLAEARGDAPAGLDGAAGIDAAAGRGRAARQARALALLRRCGLDDPAPLLARWPHQLSGGQRQRVVVAIALAAGPRVLVADEPTSALDPALAAATLDLLRGLCREDGLGLLWISHDLPGVARIADRVMVLRHGRVVEDGRTAAVFAAPAHDYTRALLAAARLPAAPAAPAREAEDAALLRVDGLALRWPRAPAPAFEGVSLALHRGEAMAVVGQSGSGKSSLARSLLRLLPRGAEAGLRGAVTLDGQPLLGLAPARLRPLRARIGVVFQDPYASLDPRQRVAELVAEPLRIHGRGDAAGRRAEAARLLAAVGLGEDALERFPHAFSGGQRQRIAIARALATGPDLLVCDEAVSALDAEHRAGVLHLLAGLKRERGLALLFITHDLDAAAALCEHALWLERGRVAAQGDCASVLAAMRGDAAG